MLKPSILAAAAAAAFKATRIGYSDRGQDPPYWLLTVWNPLHVLLVAITLSVRGRLAVNRTDLLDNIAATPQQLNTSQVKNRITP